MQSLKKNRFTLLLVLIDIIIIILSYVFSVLVVRVIGGNSDFPILIQSLVVITMIKIAINFAFGIYNIMLSHLDFNNVLRIFLVILLTNFMLVLLLMLPSIPKFMHKSVYLFITAFEVTGILGYRVGIRIFLTYEKVKVKSLKDSKRTIILGAGSQAEMAIFEINNNKDLNNYVVGFLDDDPVKLGKTISNKAVLGTLSQLDDIIEKYKIDEVILAINDFPKAKLNNILEYINNNRIGISLKQTSFMNDYKKNQRLSIETIKIEDLLERTVVKLDNNQIFDLLTDQVVLVTGGGGSIGSELCRQIFELGPKELIIFDIYENNAYDIQMELERLKYKNRSIKTELKVLIGSVYNEKRIEEIFETYKPSIVFHAAAYKHVPLMEDSAREAIRTNVIGTNNVAKLSVKYGVKKVVLVSSDKAVRPTNVMGATKRYAELIISYYNNQGKTMFSSVRFGNVLGSNGSVIPLFKKQIEDGGPITVTHKNITRYFMTIPEAVGLILQSAAYAKGGEIFILDMGEPVKIIDLANKMIMLAGLIPDVDIKIDVVGLRPGEKLYEELLIDHRINNFTETSNSRIFIEHQDDNFDCSIQIEHISSIFENISNDEVKNELSKVIKGYTRNEI
ncbi:polysaccharide biosynthesis protein [Haploplasma modicum]|uniref:polysaccharide biosynthesis protein n=1 Tax=Haploplasma modicum TaxID=2150 RepID=UPI000553BCBE|nr:nucleoside-diphosphate sugar epimerase/dehydratase [Haploplasma modicum]